MPRMKKQHLKRRPDGRYACRYKQYWFYGATEDEALAAREEHKRREAMKLASPLTVAAYAAQWLPLYKGNVSDATYNAYAGHIDKLCSAIGAKPISDVVVDDAQQVFRLYDDYSQSMVRKGRMLFIALFDAAVENGLTTHNPFRSKLVQLERKKDGSHRVITLEERNLILNTEHRFRLFALTMLYAGLRRGEAIAIRIEDDVDFDAGVIHVTKAVRFQGNSPVLSTPKTEAGQRDVPLLEILADSLRGKTGFLAPSATGKMLTQIAFSRGWAAYMNALSRAAGHKVSIRPHDLRHSYCTMLRDAGVDMKLAMLWMGHADEKMILRVYDHVTETRVDFTVKTLNQSTFRSQNGSQLPRNSSESE